MATYHCGIHIGYSGKTIPHLDYIKREGKYKEKNLDLVTSSSGHMPKWATDDREFWEAIANKDMRAYREMVLALPNELTPNEQLELVQEYIEEAIPNNPYTFAIHSPDSSIDGVPNTHVHIMFSERLNDDRVKNLSKEEWLKQKGIKINGEIFGGAVKDRSWAGEGRTSKYYEVRQLLADKINKKLKEKGLEKKVTSRSLEDEAKYNRHTGNEEFSSFTDTKRVIRIDRKIYVPYKKYIQEEAKKDTPLDPSVPDEINERILKERQKRYALNTQYSLTTYNKTIQPTKQNYEEARQKLKEEAINLLDKYESPYSISKRKLESSLDVPSQPYNSDKYGYTQIVAEAKEREYQEEYLSKDFNSKEHTIIILADLYLNKKRLANVEKQLKEKLSTPEEILKDILPKEEYQLIIDINEKIRSKESLINYEAKQNLDISTKEKELKNLKDLKARYLQQQKYTHKEKYDARIDELGNDFVKTVEAKDKATVLYNKGYTSLSEQDRPLIKEKVEEITRVETKRKEQKKTLEKANKQEIKEILRTYNRAKRPPKTLTYFEDKLINCESNNQLHTLKEKLRSEKSKLEFNEKQQKNTLANKQEIYRLNQEIINIRKHYSTPELKQEAKKLYEDYLNKNPKVNPKQLQKKVQKTMTRKHKYPRFSNVPKRIDSSLKRIINNLKNKENNNAMGAAQINVNRDTRIETMNELY